jgi:hypothetical protein
LIAQSGTVEVLAEVSLKALVSILVLEADVQA